MEKFGALRRFLKDEGSRAVPSKAAKDIAKAGRIGALAGAIGGSALAGVPAEVAAENTPVKESTLVKQTTDSVERTKLNSLIRDVGASAVRYGGEGRITDVDISCLVTNIYHEARGEADAGQLAVALVTLARAQDKRFANSVCGVIYQKNQYSWTREVELMEADRTKSATAYRELLRSKLEFFIAGKQYDDAIGLLMHMLGFTERPLYYKRTDWNENNPNETRMSVKSKQMWRNLRKLTIVGVHTFYTDRPAKALPH